MGPKGPLKLTLYQLPSRHLHIWMPDFKLHTFESELLNPPPLHLLYPKSFPFQELEIPLLPTGQVLWVFLICSHTLCLPAISNQFQLHNLHRYFLTLVQNLPSLLTDPSATTTEHSSQVSFQGSNT